MQNIAWHKGISLETFEKIFVHFSTNERNHQKLLHIELPSDLCALCKCSSSGLKCVIYISSRASLYFYNIWKMNDV